MAKFIKRLKKSGLKNLRNIVVLGTGFGHMDQLLEEADNIFVLTSTFGSLRKRNLIYRENFENITIYPEIDLVLVDRKYINSLEALRHILTRFNPPIYIQGEEYLGKEESRPIGLMCGNIRCKTSMETSPLKISVVTTFHEEGLKIYGQRMIDSFCKTWPVEVKLYVYPEKCNPAIIDHSRVTLIDLDSVDDLTKFKNKWKGVPKANGDVSKDPVRSKRRDSGKGFKWDAVRFSHKVYAIFDCARQTDSDILIWMDADTYCHSPITMADLYRMIPADKDLCFLGRKGKFSECGLYSMNLKIFCLNFKECMIMQKVVFLT